MRSSSSRPWMQPSSPQRPCSALNTQSTLASSSCAAGFSPGSISTTSKPSSRNAFAQPAPDDRLTSRSAERPPNSTATRLNELFVIGVLRTRGHAHPLDLPFELHARMRLDARAHLFAQGFDIGGGGVAQIDEEVAV